MSKVSRRLQTKTTRLNSLEPVTSSANKMRDLTPRPKKRKQARNALTWGMTDCLDRVAVELTANGERIDAIEAMSNRVQEDIRDLRKFKEEDSKFLHGRIDAAKSELSARI